MQRLLLLSHWRYLWQHPIQTILAVIGITLGVTVVVAIDLTITSADNSFKLSYQQVTGSTTHQILGGSRGVSEGFYRRLRRTLLSDFHSAQAAPVIERYVNLQGQPNHTLQVLAVDPVAEMAFERFSDSSTLLSDSLNSRFMLASDTALISRYSARQLGVKVGEHLTIESNGKAITLEIIGLFGDADEREYSNLVIMDVGNAQMHMAEAGFFDRIDFRVDSAERERFVHRLSALLSPELRLETTGQGLQKRLSLTNAFAMNLRALGLLALLVGVFLIYNTMNGFVVQRGVMFGRMRALGVDQSQVYGAVLTEALILGVAGLLLGIPFAIYLAKLLLTMATQTINDLYYVTRVTQLHITPLVVFKGILVGVGGTLIAGWAPAYRAANTSPGQQLQRISQEQSLYRMKKGYALFALLLLMIGGVTALIKESGVIGGFVTIVSLLLSAALFTPALISLLTNSLAKARLKLPVSMALRATGRNLSRTSVAAMALLIAVASTNGIGTMVESFRLTVIQWMQERVNADIYVRPVKLSGIHQGQFVPPSVIEQLKAREDLQGISLFLDFTLWHGEQKIEFSAVELPPSAQQGYRFLPQWPPRSDESIWRAFDQGEILITEPLANKLNVSVGDLLNLPTDRGEQAFPIAGVYYDYGSEHGRLLLHRRYHLNYFDRPGVEAVGLYLNPSLVQEEGELITELQQGLQSPVPLQIGTNKRFLQIGLEMFDRTFAITDVLRWLALLVAMIGLFGALIVLQLEQARELAVLRSIGFSRAQIFNQQILQAVLLGLFVGLVAIPLGFALGWVLINVINLRAFGWSMVLEPLWSLSFQNLGLAILVAVIASLYPTWRLTRQANVNALRPE
ncbi:MAG: FtsX-like permease family protein [Chromatiales bacterium]|nr:FtsX-like permease family protein [Chromatiales bacterium]